jgi:hypothetical protein
MAVVTGLLVEEIAMMALNTLAANRIRVGLR